MPTAVEEVRALEAALTRLDRECAVLDEFETEKKKALKKLEKKVASQMTELEQRRRALASTYDERIHEHEAEARKRVEEAESLARELESRRSKFSGGTLDSLFEPLASRKARAATDGEEDPVIALRSLNSLAGAQATSLESSSEATREPADLLKGGAIFSFAAFVAVAILKIPLLVNINFPVIFPGGALAMYWVWFVHPAYLRRIVAECHMLSHFWVKRAQAQAEEAAREASAGLRDERDTRIRAAEAEVAEGRAAIEAQSADEIQRIFDEQEAALAQKQAALDLMAREVDRRAFALEQEPSLAAWSAPSWTTWAPADEAVSAVRLGRKALALPRLQQHFPEVAELRVPALWSLSGDRPLLFSGTESSGREAALGVLVRLLASQPPGRVRFTVVDPARLGQSVAPLLPLLDVAPELLGGKILSDPQEIEKALAELTDHLERVIQKCLRHEFADLAAYNAQAGEVAEPYRVLAIWDFPTGWTEASLRRLLAILRNGPRCGVQTILVANRAAPLPHGFTWDELLGLMDDFEG